SYGFLVEIQSDNDDRYSDWTELKPIPNAGGFECDPSVMIRNAPCKISDPTGVHVYNPVNNGVPYWVTESTYIDPVDGDPTQFIAWSLKPNTTYNFRVRPYAGTRVPAKYSNVVTATTADYPLRYVSPDGDDNNSGTGPGPSEAWRTISKGVTRITCGQALVV